MELGVLKKDALHVQVVMINVMFVMVLEEKPPFTPKCAERVLVECHTNVLTATRVLPISLIFAREIKKKLYLYGAILTV